MIAFAKPESKQSVQPPWHVPFLRLLPTIQSYAAAKFAHLNAEAREEAVAETVAQAMVAVMHLVRRGKDPADFPGHICHFAVLHVKTGRLVAGQSAHDALSPMAQQLGDFQVSSLDDESCADDASWKAAACTDTRSWPVPDVVAFRLDFEQWLSSLSRRDRSITKRLAVGDRTGEVAGAFNVTPSGISHLRNRLRQSWEEFEGEAAACDSAVAVA